MSVAVKSEKKSGRRFGMQFLIGALVGAGAALLMDLAFPELGRSGVHEGAFFFGTLLVATGLIMLWSGSRPARAAGMMQVELEPGEDFSTEAASLRSQGIVTLLAGAELLILGLNPDVLTGPSGPLFLAGLLVVTLVQTWLNWRLWRKGDEFFRRLLVEASVITFVVLQFLIFLWAVGARFGPVPEPTALDLYVILLGIYVLAGVFAARRRGVGR